MWNLVPRFTVWEIWKEQNQRIFEGKLSTKENVWNNWISYILDTLFILA